MKKKHFIRVLALLLTLGLLAGCGAAAGSSSAVPAASEADTAAASAAAPETAETPETAPAEAAEPAEEASAEPAETEASAEEEVPEEAGFESVEYSFPLTEEPETLSYFTTVSPFFTSFMEDYSGNDSVLALEELTGVHIDYQCYIPENAQTQFNLQATAGTLPDILLGATEYYAGGMDKAVGDDILLNLADYLDSAPNFSRILELDPEMESALTTPSGNLIGFYSYSDPAINMPVSGCLMVRGDWLEQVGLDVPKTYDDVWEVLTAFHDQLGVETPMIITSYLDDQSNSFAAGYDVKAFFMTSPGLQVPFYVRDGQVKCAIVEDDFISYLDLLHSYMDAGYTAKDIESYTNEMSYQDLVTSGQVGLFWGYGVNSLETLNDTVEEGGWFACVPAIRKTEDQTLHFTATSSYQVRSAVSISANCSNVELACKWLDCHYTDEVSMLSMYGVEGLSYETGADGVPHYTEMMTASDGFTLMINQALHCLAAADNLYYRSINTDMDTFTDNQRQAMELINSGSMDGEYVYPDGASMTEEETEAYSALIADLSTYMAEHVLKFVVGEEDMADYPAFVQALNDMGMQEAIGYRQAAYDRYIGG